MSSFTIASFNIANAVGDETSNMRFGLRLAKLSSFIKSKNLDVVCLQELRQCKNESGDKILTPLDIAYKLAKNTNLEIANLFSLNPSELAFSRLTLYNPKTVFPLNAFGEWVSNTPTKISGWSDEKPARFGNGIQYVFFAPIVEREAPTVDYNKMFITANAHFPLGLPEKLYTANILKQRIPVLSNGVKTIIVGDFNTFENEGFVEQMDVLRSVFTEESGNIEHTFMTFPHDRFAVENGKMMYSKLDHVFSYPQGDKFVEKVEVYDTVENRESDHFMLVATIKV